MLRVVVAFLALAALPVEGLAWNAAGHKTITSILWRRLSEERRAELADLLTHHPRYQPDIVAALPDSVKDADPMIRGEWLLQQASVWPDLVRGGPPERTAFNRPGWHYLPKGFFFADAAPAFRKTAESGMNMKLDPVGGSENPDWNGPQAFQANLALLKNPSAPKPDRAVALCWVLHLGQDLHQPCHTASLCLPRLFPEGDRGANSVKTTELGNLHAVWDSPLGPNDRYEQCRDLAIVLLGEAGPAALQEHVGDADVEMVKWLNEGWQLAAEAVYIGEVKTQLLRTESEVGSLPVISLTENYLRNVRKVANKRFVMSGVRLGHLLK